MKVAYEFYCRESRQFKVKTVDAKDCATRTYKWGVIDLDANSGLALLWFKCRDHAHYHAQKRGLRYAVAKAVNP